jgi:hypothetical protein
MSPAATAVALTVACLLARSAFAQVPAPSGPVGVWRGTSKCLVHPSACKDEVVVYRITRLNARDSLSLDARKIVKGKEEGMGVLSCQLAASRAGITCTMPNGVWHFTLRGDNMAGELRLPDNTKYRDVRLTRSR